MNTSVTGLCSHLQNEHSYNKSSKSNSAAQQLLAQTFFKVESAQSSNSNIPRHPTLKSREDRERYLFFRYIVVWICRDLLPFTVVCSQGFNHFWNKFNTKKHLNLPSRTTIAGQALDDAYNVIKKQMNIFLQTAPSHGAITFDTWTDSHRRVGYITFTYHFINDEWDMFSTVLKTTHFEYPHNAEHIKTHLCRLLEEYRLNDKNIVYVTDGGSNVKSVCTLLKTKRLNCLAHQLNRLIQFDMLDKNKTILKPIVDLLEKLRKIQRALVYKHEELCKIYRRDRDEQIFVILEQFELIEEYWNTNEHFIDGIESNMGSFNGIKSFNTIRWSCIYLMVKFHHDHMGTIKKCLQDNERYELILGPDELTLLANLVGLLEVFHTITKFIQGDSYATYNLLPIFYSEAERSLKNIIENFNTNIEDEDQNEPTILTAAKILLSNLEKRLEITPESIVAAIVDPAMQHLPLIDEWLRKRGMKKFIFAFFMLINN